MRMFLVPPDPRFAAVDAVRERHVPRTVRRSASVCTECGEAWPCTSWAWADDEDFRLLQDGPPEIIEFDI